MTKTQDVNTGNITAGASNKSLGGFTITPVWGSTPAPYLTDDSGNTYVYAPGNTSEGQEIAATGTGNAVATTTVKLSVKYDETLTSADEINAAWQAVVTAITVNISDVSTGFPSGGGIKFYEAATPADWSDYDASLELTWNLAAMQALEFTWDGTAEAGSKCVAQETSTQNVFYGIKGVNGTVNDSTATYKMQADVA